MALVEGALEVSEHMASCTNLDSEERVVEEEDKEVALVHPRVETSAALVDDVPCNGDAFADHSDGS